MITHAEILARLKTMAESDYAVFSASLIPNCPPLLGVRLPALRRYAGELARMMPEQSDLLREIDGDGEALLELRLLHGMVIGAAKLPSTKRRKLLEEFLPLIDNWSVCDSTAASCKWMAAEPDFWLRWLRELAECNDEFTARFGIVCLLDHFTSTHDGRRATLDACAAAVCPALYTRLGAAWAVSIVTVKEPALGLAFLQNDSLDAFTHNKAIQKIRESRRASPELREAVNRLKRRKKF